SARLFSSPSIVVAVKSCTFAMGSHDKPVARFQYRCGMGSPQSLRFFAGLLSLPGTGFTMANVSLRYDLRFPAFADGTHGERYAACLDQCAWADELGLRSVTLCEHHGVEDGFMSAPLTIAAAVAARTRRIGISIVAALLPLHDPIRLAEQC